jgi:hypothetical protein
VTREVSLEEVALTPRRPLNLLEEEVFLSKNTDTYGVPVPNMSVQDADEAWGIAKAFLKKRGYGTMYADSLKTIQLDGTVWRMTALFVYGGEYRKASISVDSGTGKIIGFKVEP